MSDLLKTLTSIRALRVATKEFTLQELESILEKFQLITNERRQLIEENQRKEQERLERIAKYKALLAQDGLTLTDLVDDPTFTTKRPRKKIAPRKAKYQYTDQNGKVKTWTGQGRMPLSLQAELNTGKTLADFEI
ncbi:H-NS family histone-like protein [Histophilus somni]|uniref:DNA-binding protein n=1 Tax=Histophilus somni TaxID=731 RepID=A0A9Q6K879_HISSO|nr:H-NS family nucleoid-associated regulatory protein [Histophilus somni]ACA30983.1 histone family protein nucleoid-structuring protein H-NS [Histophilus somni 2336]ARU64995.1 DNA-binding protein H-NS-like protein [Histophilus somni]ARU66861.1 DNA-binding protein H-NS-like protein [Histophilus somni]ARU68732.1 DNA-binding protein H-NS-like protein [Histophilus somni]ARU70614.1 DNA-binding protein H-NS-like protein [Histophilus somni]